MTEIKLLDYSPELSRALMKIEESNLQGSLIQLKIHKDHFLQRARVFKDYAAYIGELEGEIVGSGVISMTRILVNNEEITAAFGFDVKVSSEHRGKGVGKWLSEQAVLLSKERFKCDKAFVTLKVSNLAVQKIVEFHAKDNFMYPFVYLTIPVSERVIRKVTGRKRTKFRVVNSSMESDSEFTKKYKNDTGYFRTYLMYSLSVEKIHPIFNFGYELLRFLGPKKYRSLPSKGRVFKTCTAFGLHEDNVQSINEMLKDIKSEGVEYLMVCCQKGDTVYKTLKPLSIDETRYLMGANFPIKESDLIALDVRCC